MATTPEGRRLTEQHRRAQVANQQGFLREFLAAWALLDVTNLDFATPNWLRLVMRIIEVFRQDSARIALDYSRRFREIEVPGVDDPFPDIEFYTGEGPRVVLDLPRGSNRVPRAGRGRPRNQIPLRRSGPIVINWRDRDPQVEASLRVTGPHTIKYRIGRGETPERAKRNALVDAGGAGMRHVADGGRDSLLTVVRNDRRAIGYIRVSDGNPCSFCAMLISRGPVFKSEWAAGGSNRRSDRHATDPRTPFIGKGDFKVHDNCGCTAEIVYSDATAWPGRGKEFQRLWNDHIQGRFSGKDAINAWRRLYERPEAFKDKQYGSQRRRAA